MALLALLLSCAALAVALRTARRSASRRPAAARPDLPRQPSGAGPDGAVAAPAALSRIGLVRYDAFGDSGGQLSHSVALLDPAGNGLVLTTITGRSDTRSYAKPVLRASATSPLSPEEVQAVRQALAGGLTADRGPEAVSGPGRRTRPTHVRRDELSLPA